MHGDNVRIRQPLVLGGFRSVLPLHSSEQDASLAWLARLHAASLGRDDVEAILRHGRRHSCRGDRIATRHHEVPDFGAPASAEGLLGAPLQARMAFFASATGRALRAIYPDDLPPDAAPDELIHVTCTGYTSPSAAQVRVSELGWGARTRVTHAYHMGCHAAIPALRMAAGAASLGARSVDVMHSEICSLHVRPGATDPAQWVIQSLFADGFIRFRLQSPDEPAEAGGGGACLELLSIDEIIAPATIEQMTWVPGEDAFVMTLARGVPNEIGRGAPALVDRLLSGLHADPARAIFAVHPGGPRVLEAVGESLRLDESQLAHSRALLRSRGNMSSATLPHLWEAILADEAVPDGTIVVTLGFGPGLTLAGAALRIRRPA